MQKIKLIHYASRVKYLATQETQDINILIAPVEFIAPLIVDELHPNTLAGKASHAVAWTEHADHPKHNLSSGDLTTIVLKLAKATGKLEKFKGLASIPEDKFSDVLEEVMDELSKENYHIPQYIGTCDETTKVTALYDNDDSSKATIKKMLEENQPYFLSNKDSPPPKNKALKALAELLKDKVSDTVIIGPNGPVNVNDPNLPPEIRKIVQMFEKNPPEKDVDVNIKVPPRAEGLTTPEPKVPEEPKPKKIGELKALMSNKNYKKKDLKELVNKMGVDKLKNVYPEEEVTELLAYLKIETNVKN